jgi:phosphonopyruvate decarboxylase
MGQTTKQILMQMGVDVFKLPKTHEAAKQTIDQAMAALGHDGKSVALLVGPGTFKGNAAFSGPKNPKNRDKNCKNIVKDLKNRQNLPSRYNLLTAIVDAAPKDAALIATTGKCGRELYQVKDRSQHFYMVGSMGSAGAIGLGVALNNKKPVLVLDGDGGVLMRLGTMATIGRMHPANLIHLILDNEAHDSTGGQPTGSDNVDFPAIAAACSYASATSCDDIETAVSALAKCTATPGPHLLHIQIQGGSLPSLGRPEIQPYEVAARFRRFLTSTASGQ